MIRRFLLTVSAVTAPLLIAVPASAAIDVNPATAITRQVTVQLIQTALDNGASPATAFGNASQRANIEASLDVIWAQAGIDINVLPTITSWNNTTAYRGDLAVSPRPSGDLNSTFTSASNAGKLSLDLLTLNLILVDRVPAFAQLGESQAAGYARVSGNGIMGFVGDNLLTFQDGLDVVASVMGHEIGHNLGLDHVGDANNLMAGSNGTSERLTSGQVSTARLSNFARLYTPLALTGDYNGNHVVDAADYVVWRNKNGPAADYTAWRNNFGKTGGAGSGTGGSGTSAVPEPAALACLLIAISARLAARRNRGQQERERTTWMGYNESAQHSS